MFLPLATKLGFFKMKHASSVMDAMDIVEEFIELGREVSRLSTWS